MKNMIGINDIGKEVVSMKKLMMCAIAMITLLGMASCGKKETVQYKDSIENIDVSVAADSEKENILIAYFSWADNTVVEDEDAAVQSALSHYKSIGDSSAYSGTDAVSSASIVSPGNTAQVASYIQEYLGGDLFPIVVQDLYPDNYDKCLDRAAEEKAKKSRPELKNSLENMDDYDIIFLGFPNWWSSAPMPVFSFIEQYDLSGKTIVPFCCHGTSGIAKCVSDIAADLPENTNILNPLGIYRADINNAKSKVNDWLSGLGFNKKESADGGKTLIAYFSRWGNTDFPKDIDATSSASIVESDGDRYGTTEYLARLIQKSTGGDLYLIKTKTPYPADYNEVRTLNHKEMAENIVPDLLYTDLDINQYDTVFIGYPVWATGVPQAVISFLKEYDLSGKTVIPFCTHGGYGAGDSYNTIKEASHASNSPDGLAVKAEDVISSQNVVNTWLKKIEVK